MTMHLLSPCLPVSLLYLIRRLRGDIWNQLIKLLNGIGKGWIIFCDQKKILTKFRRFVALVNARVMDLGFFIAL